MGQFFERILMQEKGLSGVMAMMSGIPKAMAAIGYRQSEEGIGVPFHLLATNDPEWADFQSPLLESTSETAEPLLKALSREGRAPVLSLTCVDSDFVLCRLIDEANGTDTVACLNQPYEDLGFGEPDYTAWSAMCKKKWKCKPDRFKAVFERSYPFAEDGLESLAGLLHFSPAVLPEGDGIPAASTLWFLPEQEWNETTRLHTRAEKLADYMEREYAAKFEAAGFRRYKNSPVRWHKVVGEPGNEVLLSMVFTVYYGYEFEPMYGAQSLCCPLVLSDKYLSLHIADEYWREARHEYPEKFGRFAFVKEINGKEVTLECYNLEQVALFIDELMLPELNEVSDLASCRAYYLTPRKREYVLHDNTPKTRLWIETALDGDEADVQRWYEYEKEKAERSIIVGSWNQELVLAMVNAYETGGREGLVGYLRDTVYRDNMKKLKRAGII